MVTIKTPAEIRSMREGGKKLAAIMDELIKIARPGISTLEIDKLAEKLVFDNGGKPSFKGYGGDTERGFPATICASINSEVVHGIPSEKIILQDGDVFKIDIGMEYEGFHTDMARTITIGNVGKQASKLMEVTEKAFWAGIKKLKAGKYLSEYSKEVQKYVEGEGFSVVRNLVGHGIGREVHEDPQIPNYYNKKYQEVKLQTGMTLALEPMVNAGGFETVLGHDGWVFKTKDGSMSAHYENTVLITNNGVEVLTAS
jgi:methionyl aminopeptidase